jgi:ABC-type dipeptide/oligopeptide/nickel transport system ATPase subunit
VTVDKAEVQAMINATVAPIAREQKRQRKRIASMEKRVEVVEGDVKSALQVAELVKDVVTEGFGRLEIKMDKQHSDIVARLDVAEGWIGRRRRLETAAVRLSQLAVVAALRRIFPFAALWLVLMNLWLLSRMKVRL